MVSAVKQRALDHEALRKRDREMIPTVLVRAMFALVVCVLIIVAYARLTDRPLVAQADDSATPVVTDRLIVLNGSMSGAAQVHDMDGTLLADLSNDEGGFVAGIFRVMQRTRMQHGVPVDAPIRLVLFEDSRLALRDDYTGWRAELMGFGADNYRVFFNLLDLPNRPRA